MMGSYQSVLPFPIDFEISLQSEFLMIALPILEIYSSPSIVVNFSHFANGMA
ncbi:hypothetical protein HHK36_025355 [Tetracentron sinense]|uniref:Uncharacterized protein n=1 Tax=Tetracentron sinense TaxID=13715 RepID=A0A834YIK7_TETSI|nr:hypothetical protein HHK36_025355 [Tetracentron sinense]